MHGDRGMSTAVPHPRPDAEEVERPRVAKALRALAIPILVFWILAAIVTNVFVPSIEVNTAANAEAEVPRDAPSSQAAILQGRAFHESDYTSAAVILFETKGRKLGEQDHQYYNEVVRRLQQDKQHVQSLLNLWGKPVTMSGQQSADAEAATLTVRPTGDLGDASSNHSIDAIRDIVAKVPKPSGLNVYVSGPSPLASDTLHAADESLTTLTIVTIILIIVMLLIAYRSATRALIPLAGVLITLATARGVVSFFVGLHVLGISSFATNMVVALVLGVSTDYGIFYLGRYHEARRAGFDKEAAYYTSVANTSHVVMGSGMAISGATLCLSLTKLNYFRTLGPPCFVAMVVAVAGALTLGPALLTLGSKIKYLEAPRPTGPMWRRLGTAIARWPAAVLAIAILVIPLAILNLASYKVSYNDRDFAPATVESSKGYAASDRHFPKSELSTDVLYVQADHDMRNTTDMITLDRIAKSLIRLPGIALVQGITRPNGRAIEHASLPYSLGAMGTKLGENIGFLRDRVADIDTLAAKTGSVIEITRRLEDITQELSVGTHISRESAERLKSFSEEARDHLADYDDFSRPMRSYFYWEKHCFDVPICWALRSLLESVDSVDEITNELGNEVHGLTIIDAVTPRIITQIHAVATNLESIRSLTLTLQSTLHALIPQLDVFINPLVDMAQAFDAAKNDDFFFLPPDALTTPDFKVGMDFFMTPDGRGARTIVYHQGEAMSPEGIKQIRDVSAAAQESIKGTPLSNAQLYVAGAASNYRDVEDFSYNDLIIMMLATFGLVFIIVLMITRALAGSIVVLITVILSFAGSLGLATFVWETLLGIQLHWLTIPISFIVLVGVGCDYNLLLLSRYKEEIDAGFGTGLIRAMAGSGNVVVTAALVLAGTMLALLSSDVVNIGQAGSTICIGLIFDMMIVRLFLVMPLARILGPWFWWPQKIRRSPGLGVAR
ncbi:membrane protein MmpL [Mycobacterium lentiflavum]|uniref:Membrane protein MmpL n=2 Tax=Mycobacterium lentiflavum TaxID=141349 RepID=A0A0E4CMD2_MYCLN|nr:membrane protein MmpL [Mycobacterium lentiflavum]